MDQHLGTGAVFPLGEPNDAYADYFSGKSYLAVLTTQGVPTMHVTFEPGSPNWWHIHHLGGQILLVTGGKGWYQQEGQPPRRLLPGDAVHIPAEVKHWHGAARDSWFSHIAIEIPAPGGSNEWVGPVAEQEYCRLEEQEDRP